MGGGMMGGHDGNNQFGGQRQSGDNMGGPDASGNFDADKRKET